MAVGRCFSQKNEKKSLRTVNMYIHRSYMCICLYDERDQTFYDEKFKATEYLKIEPIFYVQQMNPF